uniref:Endonuclease/exonuclease/phosphatase domain-containing protein n=1 Tax=Sinocyclocheilus grahami TaxID=75366 RepID=A0A672T1V5_SINGR
MYLHFSLFTYTVGIRYLSKNCKERFVRIGDLLNQEQLDLALLQEVWCERDFLFLKKKLSSIYPYSHYFKSTPLSSVGESYF